MREDIAEMRAEIMEAILIIKQLELLDELDKEISRNIRALVG